MQTNTALQQLLELKNLKTLQLSFLKLHSMTQPAITASFL